MTEKQRESNLKKALRKVEIASDEFLDGVNDFNEYGKQVERDKIAFQQLQQRLEAYVKQLHQLEKKKSV